MTDVKIGEEVVIHHGTWDRNDPWVKAGKDPMIAPSGKIWGYETNFGSFGQFTVVQAHQVMPKASHLTWEAAAASSLVGTTAYRMLHGWQGNEVQEGDVVLVWGGSGGLGSIGIQIAKIAGAKPVAVVSSDERGEYCKTLGAVGYINRTEFDHWGVPPHWTDNEGQKKWTASARAFGKKLWDAVGERKNPAIVFEHRLRCSCVIRAAWWWCVREPRVSRRRLTCATSGFGRSDSRARTAPTTSRRTPTTTWWCRVSSTPASGACCRSS